VSLGSPWGCSREAAAKARTVHDASLLSLGSYSVGGLWTGASTPEERLIPPPAGDRLLTDGKRTGTMANTTEAAPSFVWPWLVQIGMGRGGWYSWDRLDNAARPSARAIVPE
jgi:hypothetical protein